MLVILAAPACVDSVLLAGAWPTTRSRRLSIRYGHFATSPGTDLVVRTEFRLAGAPAIEKATWPGCRGRQRCGISRPWTDSLLPVDAGNPVAWIFGGTTEIQKEIIARSLGLQRDQAFYEAHAPGF